MEPNHDKLLNLNKETLGSLDTTGGADKNAEEAMSTSSDHVHNMDTESAAGSPPSRDSSSLVRRSGGGEWKGAS
jgi:hypothetical protein